MGKIVISVDDSCSLEATWQRYICLPKAWDIKIGFLLTQQVVEWSFLCFNI